MKRLKLATCRDLKSLVMEMGFIPLFQNETAGFSVMDCTGIGRWWTGDEKTDPWMWRMILAEDPAIAYGKLFRNRAGFVSREWFPYFASYRRDDYDFDARYDDGKASHKCKKIMDLFHKQTKIPSYQIKSMAGFSDKGEKGFEGALTLLQMQTYVTVRGFTRKQNKAGECYGWHVGVYSAAENKFGKNFTAKSYRLGAEGSREKLVRQMMKINPGIGRDDALKHLK